ncbi:MAG: hypothetical protein LC099_09775 [Anaerolineales bacterium]|nr:hypothetical protein [Anaerolineales bacterium]
MTRKRKKTQDNGKMQTRLFIAKLLFRVNAACWAALGAYYVYQMAADKNGWASALVGIFFVFMVVVLLYGARIVERREKLTLILCAVIAAGHLLYTIFGVLDFVFVLVALLDVIILIDLFALKDYYLEA